MPNKSEVKMTKDLYLGSSMNILVLLKVHEIGYNN